MKFYPLTHIESILQRGFPSLALELLVALVLLVAVVVVLLVVVALLLPVRPSHAQPRPTA